MLKRVLAVGDGPALAAAIERAAEDTGMIVRAVTPGDRLPDAAAAIVTARPDANLPLDAAGVLGDRYEAVLRLIGQALDVREGKAPGTTERVYEHAARFAEALELGADDRIALEHAGYLQDIGKLSISNDVLIKKSLLTYDEWMQLQSHPKLGAELLRKLDVYVECADIIRYHHECYDGTGYPDRLEKDAIPRLARAMRILDVYCAMTTPRIYRKGYSTHEQAIEYLESERGKHFDPELLDVFVGKAVGRPMRMD